MNGLPAFEDLRCRAITLLREAQDELRSDWQPETKPTQEQTDALSEARNAISEAETALNRAGG